MNRDALEQALALQQSPILRFSLRGQPPAPNLLTVIQLAAASQPLLEDTARRLDMGEGSVLEAARFYLQQVLFEGEPEAYRTLAVAPDADIADIREHYRWLQRWLHPDRRGEDWEALFTSRLNWAWSLLRNDAARAAYDEQRRQPPQATTGAAPTVETPGEVAMASGEWRMVPIIQGPSPRRYLKSMALGTAFVVCCGLLYLAIVREDAERLQVMDTRTPSLVAVAEPHPDTADASTAVVASKLDAPVPSTAPTTMDAAFAAGMAASRTLTHVSAPARGSTVAETTEEAPAQVDVASMDGPERPLFREANIDRSDVAPLAPAPPATRVATTPRALVAPPTPVLAPAADPIVTVVTTSRRDPEPVTASNSAPDRRAARVTREPKVASPAVSPNLPAPAPPIVASTRPVEPEPVKSPVTVTASQVSAAPIVSKTVETPLTTNEEPASSTLLGAANMPVTTQPIAQPAAVSARSPSMPPPTLDAPPESTPSTAPSPDEMVARIDDARESMRQLVSYYGRTDAGEPQWPDANAPYSARHTRRGLRERTGLPLAARFTLDSPQWRMSSDAIAVEAAYRVERDRGIAEHGRLRVDMVWGGDAWQFNRVELVPQQ